MIKPIHLVEDTITHDELKSLSQWLETAPRLTKGPLCMEFEHKFSQWQGSEYSIFVNSGSSANLLMIYALLEGGYLRNKNVVAPAVSWVTTVSPLMQLGFNITLCDCDKKNLGLDVEHLEEICRKGEISLIILVHVLGHANDMDKILEICQKYNIILVEDSCEALGSTLNEKKLGSLGKAGSFSFYFGHQMSTIEGGMVVTDDRKLYNLMLSIRSHGWGRDVEKSYRTEWEEHYDIDVVRALYTFYYPGFNLRSTDLNAFLGLLQLKKLDDIVNARERNFHQYSDSLKGFWQQHSANDRLSSFAFGVLVKNRREVFEHLAAAEIETRPLICGNIGRHPFWTNIYGHSDLPNADIIHEYGLYLPNNYSLSQANIERICTVFKEIAIPLHE